MPSNSPANLPETQTLLIAAVSGRALAAAARRAGLQPRVVDYFNDLDTCALTKGRLATADAERGFAAGKLVDSLHDLARDDHPIGLIYGAGFEDRPHVLAELARHWRLLGNSPEVVVRAKDPEEIADICARLSIPHPEIAFHPPRDLEHWLIKKTGGGGGTHIVAACERSLAPGEYYQRRVGGAPVSVLLLADGKNAVALGLSAQWATPCAAQAFRFGGAVQPANPACAHELCEAASRIARSLALRGLNSIDFLVAGDVFHLVEINPRPGATLDIFADADGRLLRAHVEACEGILPGAPLTFARAAASAIAYARHDLAAMPELDWPAWCNDRQKPGTRVGRDEPICSIFAEADEPVEARERVAERLADFLRRVASKASKVDSI
jgi:uncharacterized protein